MNVLSIHKKDFGLDKSFQKCAYSIQKFAYINSCEREERSMRFKYILSRIKQQIRRNHILFG